MLNHSRSGKWEVRNTPLVGRQGMSGHRRGQKTYMLEGEVYSISMPHMGTKGQAYKEGVYTAYTVRIPCFKMFLPCSESTPGQPPYMGKLPRIMASTSLIVSMAGVVVGVGRTHDSLGQRANHIHSLTPYGEGLVVKENAHAQHGYSSMVYTAQGVFSFYLLLLLHFLHSLSAGSHSSLPDQQVAGEGRLSYRHGR